MKNYMFFGIICLSLIFQSGVRAEFASPEEFKKVNSAIEASDVAVVKNFLKNYALRTTKEKNDLLEKATAALTARQQRISLLKSPWDLAKLTSGTFLTFMGGLLGATLSYGLYKNGVKGTLGSTGDKAAALSIPLILASGFTLMKKGWRCTTALNHCENAEKIKLLISKKHKD